METKFQQSCYLINIKYASDTFKEICGAILFYLLSFEKKEQRKKNQVEGFYYLLSWVQLELELKCI